LNHVGYIPLSNILWFLKPVLIYQNKVGKNLLYSYQIKGNIYMNTKDLESKIIAKCWKDPEFRKKFIQNPNETVHSWVKNHPEFKKLADGLSFKAIECKQNDLVIALPPAPTEWGNLSESELEKLAAAHAWLSEYCATTGQFCTGSKFCD